MSSDRLERRLPEVLTELSLPRMPDYVDDLLSRTERMSQRPGWTFLERWIPVSTLTQVMPAGRRPILQPLIAVALLLALVIATLALYFGTQQRLPPLFGPARNGVVVTATPDGDIVSIDPVSGEARTLVAGPNLCCVDVSPDGRRFAFLATAAGEGEFSRFAIANVDGSGLREFDPRLVQLVESFAWSPQGDRMLIAYKDGTVIVDVARERETLIDTPFQAVRASWIGTSGDILLTERLDDSPATAASIAIHRLEAGSTSGAVELARPDWAVDYPIVSPDGSKFVYFIWGELERTHGRIHVFDLATNTDRAITPEIEEDRADRHHYLGPVWSPDSSLIAAELYTDAEARIVVLSADGDGREVKVGPAFPEMTNGAAMQFSPDGQSILATYRHNNETWLLPIDGNEGRKVPWAATEEIDWQRLAP